MPPPVAALVLLAMTSGAHSDTDIANAFARALANPDRTEAVSLTGSLHGVGTLSLRDAMERFHAIDVRSCVVRQSAPDAIEVVLDATGTVVNAARDRRPLPRVWRLGIHPVSRRVTSVKSDAHAWLDRILSAPDIAARAAIQAAPASLLRAASRLLTDARLCPSGDGSCQPAARQLLAEADERSDAVAATFAAAALARSSNGDSAASAARQARFWAERSRDPDARASADLIAAHLEPDNRRKEAFYASAAACAELADDPRPALGALWEQAYLVLKRFDMAATLLIAEDLETRSRRIGWTRGEMLGLYRKAQVTASTADYESAQGFIRQSADLAAALEDRDLHARALNLMAMFLSRSGRREEAIPFLYRALNVAPADEAEIISILHTVLGELLWGLGKPADIAMHVETALRTGRASNSIFLGPTLGFAANFARSRGRYRESMELHREAIRIQGDETLWHVWAQKTHIAEILAACGDPDAAIEELYQAVDLVEARRTLAKSSDVTRARYFREHVFVYEQLIGTLLSRNRYEEALVVAERIRARVLFDSLNDENQLTLTPAETEELRALNERLVRLNRSSLTANAPAEIRHELRQARHELQSFEGRLSLRYPGASHSLNPASHLFDAPLPPHTAAVEFVVMPWTVIAFVMRGETIHAVRLPTRTNVIARQAAKYGTLLARRDAGYAAEARTLYDLLLGPLASELAGARNLVLIPDGFLWNVPFEALMAADGAFVGDHFAVEYRPSLRPLLNEQRRRPDKELLVLANPGSGPSQRLGDLPEATREARSISRLYGAKRSDLYSGPTARETLFKETASRYRVIHVATHAFAERDAPMHSSVLLSSDGVDGEDGVLEAREIARMKLSAQVVVLAACDTAGSTAVRGEGLLGLSWSFLAAGSSSVVVSRWGADSASTSKLMIEFHRVLVGNRLTPAEALRNAHQKLRKDVRYRNPFYWASFVVIASGRGR